MIPLTIVAPSALFSHEDLIKLASSGSRETFWVPADQISEHQEQRKPNALEDLKAIINEAAAEHPGARQKRARNAVAQPPPGM